MADTKPVWSMTCSTCYEMQTVSAAGLGRQLQREAERLAAQHLARNPGHVVLVGYLLDFATVFGEPAGEG